MRRSNWGKWWNYKSAPPSPPPPPPPSVRRWSSWCFTWRRQLPIMRRPSAALQPHPKRKRVGVQKAGTRLCPCARTGNRATRTHWHTRTQTSPPLAPAFPPSWPTPLLTDGNYPRGVSPTPLSLWLPLLVERLKANDFSHWLASVSSAPSSRRPLRLSLRAPTAHLSNL